MSIRRFRGSGVHGSASFPVSGSPFARVLGFFLRSRFLVLGSPLRGGSAGSGFGVRSQCKPGCSRRRRFCNASALTVGFSNDSSTDRLASLVRNARSMAGFRDYREFDAWKLADAVRCEINDLVHRGVFRSAADLKSQLLRAAESACANFAEGFSRYHPHDNAHFVRISRSSLSEVLEHLESAVQRRVIERADADRIGSLARRSRGACTRLIVYLETADAPAPKGAGSGTRRAAKPQRRTRNQEPKNQEPKNRERKRTREPNEQGT